jgi:hypothetical protein
MYGLKILSILLVMSTPVMADAIVELPIPTGVESQPGRVGCVGSGFNADHSIFGMCSGTISQACSGRGCNPATTTTYYIAAWDQFGNPVSAKACESIRHHLPQANVTTYLNGHTSCPVMDFDPTKTVVVIDWVPYYYVATDPTSGAELLNSNAAGFLYLP